MKRNINFNIVVKIIFIYRYANDMFKIGYYLFLFPFIFFILIFAHNLVKYLNRKKCFKIIPRNTIARINSLKARNGIYQKNSIASMYDFRPINNIQGGAAKVQI